MKLSPFYWRKRFWESKFWDGFRQEIPDPTLWEALKGVVLNEIINDMEDPRIERIVRVSFWACVSFLVFLHVSRFTYRCYMMLS